MGILISSKDQQKLYNDKEIITVGTNSNCDFHLNLGFDLLLTIQYNASANNCILMNNFGSDKILFRGEPIPQKIRIEKMCKLMIADTDNFISVKIADNNNSPSVSNERTVHSATVNNTSNRIAPPPVPPKKTMEMIENEDFNETDIKGLYGPNINALTKIKVEKRKADIESRRVSILKEMGYAMDDLKNKLNINELISKIANIGLILIPFITAIMLSDYFKELYIYETGQTKAGMPLHMRILLSAATLLLFISFALKQGAFLYVQNKVQKYVSNTSKLAETGLLAGSVIAYLVIFTLISIIYLNPSTFVLPVPVTLVAVFGVGLSMCDAIFCGYLKHLVTDIGMNLDKHESREDFQKVIQDYQHWILLFINNLSKTRIDYIKNKQFNLQIKAGGEIILGILTAPFLAYGVSNTLAMCFPEAAGWIRISGLRFSPIFLTLATFMIIFAFFSLVSSFVCTKRAQSSEMIIKDGFSNFQHHGVDIYGSDGIKKLKQERSVSFGIALIIIFIEFSMNISYFITEIGGEWEGLFLSCVAALVPTALLIAETYMLSKTQYEIFIQEQVLSKFDKDF